MSKLAIKGHLERGNEVIKLLEILGGENIYKYTGASDKGYYSINSINVISCTNELIIDNKIYCYTLEEFLEKFPYKIGDKVIFGDIDNIVWEIESMQWVNNEINYIIQDNNKSRLCDIKVEHLQPYKEETIKESIENSFKKTNKVIFETNSQCCNIRNEIIKKDMKQVKINIPKGYKFFGIDDNNKIVLTEKQPQYPKDYEECFNICFGNKHHIVQVVGLDGLGDNKELFESFIKLKICRDTYWKIAGEELGLGKSWDSVCGCGEWGYWIGYDVNVNKICCLDSEILLNHLLIFPTKEMRDAFYENFKELIEQCKELL